MPLQFTTPRRRTVHKRRHVNHRKPTTIREKMIAGLQVMGFEKVESRTNKYDVFSHGGQFWYVGDNGALRIGATVAGAHPAGPITRDLILTAPIVRPIVREILEGFKAKTETDNLLRDRPFDVDPEGLVRDVIRNNESLTEVSPRIILNHVNTWLKEQKSDV